MLSSPTGPTCAGLEYPRSVRSVLSIDEREYLSRLYFHVLRPASRRQPGLTYFRLLSHLARTKDEQAWAILRRLQRTIRSMFGQEFELVNDFFSFRSPTSRMFQDWHQDGEFWLTANGEPAFSCSGFNLWILLDHRRMNYSFDVIDTGRYMPMYMALYRAARVARRARNASDHATLLNTPDAVFGSSANQKRKALLHPLSLARIARRSGAGRKPWVNIPLEAGDALILRQVEIHRTDARQPDPDQWRLALGFKVMRRGTVVRRGDLQSPFGMDSLSVRAHWPGLLPDFTVGRPLPMVYNKTAVDVVKPARMSAQGVWALFQAAGMLLCPEALCVDSGRNPLIFIFPVMVVLLIFAIRHKPHASKERACW